MAPTVADQLRGNGVTLTAKYLGSVTLLCSSADMVQQMRTEVVLGCIQNVAATVGICPEEPINSVVCRLIGDVKQENYKVNLKISSKTINVIKKGQLVQSHPLTYFSCGYQGLKGTRIEKMFGYIAKTSDTSDRRCHVFSSNDVQMLMNLLTAAVNLHMKDTEPKPSTSTRPCLTVEAVTEDVGGKTWYHENLSRADAEAMLRKPGEFLVRKSYHTSEKFILSGLTNENEHKHLLLLDENNRIRTRESEFNSISELVDYYMETGMSIQAGERHSSFILNLVWPISSRKKTFKPNLMQSIDHNLAEKLRRNEVSLPAIYLGSVPFCSSLDFMAPERREGIVLECIQHVAGLVSACPKREMDPIVEKLIGDVKEENYKVDLNITSETIRINKDDQLIQQHPFSYFTLGVKGKHKIGGTEKMFGYIAKTDDESDQRCHVFSSDEVEKLIDVLTTAVYIFINGSGQMVSTSNHDLSNRLKAEPTLKDPPTIPLRRRTTCQESAVFINNTKINKPSISNNGIVIPNSLLDRQIPTAQQTNHIPTLTEDVKGKIWYHGNLSRVDAQKLLRVPGDFLVRTSDNSPGSFILSGLTDDNEPKHVLLLDSNKKVRSGDKDFNNISELINYHMNNGIKLGPEGNLESSVSLKRPIPHEYVFMYYNSIPHT